MTQLSKIILLLSIAILIACSIWYLRPQKATLSGSATGLQGEIIDVPITIDTQGHVINAAEVYLTFDRQQLEIVEISKDSSIFQLWIDNQPQFSNETGTISLAGGLPTPGFQGKGQIGTVRLKAKAKGRFRLHVEARTQALLNDGQGTILPLQLEPIEIKVT